jgi:hypothetical protein
VDRRGTAVPWPSPAPITQAEKKAKRSPDCGPEKRIVEKIEVFSILDEGILFLKLKTIQEN